MKKLLSLLILMALVHFSHAQDSIKVKNKIITQIQSWPNKNKQLTAMKADSLNGLWILLWGLEGDSAIGKFEYFIQEKDRLAIIKKDPSSSNAFYVTPISKKLKSKGTDQIELEIWISTSNTNLYYPDRKSPNVPIYDRNGSIIPENILWKPFKSKYELQDNKYKIVSQTFRVILQ